MSDHGPAPHVFTEEELSLYRAEDFSAGRAVVIEMVAIFSIGVVLYSVVAWTIMM